MSRKNVYDCQAFQNLVDAILQSTDDNDYIIIVISSLDRIGVEEEKINKIIKKLESLRSKIVFISMNEYGADPMRASNLLGSYHEGRKIVVKTCSNHINPGDSFKTPIDSEKIQSRVLANVEQLKANWRINGIEDWISNAVSNGEESHPYEAEVKSWIDSMKWDGSMDESEIEWNAGSFPFVSTYQGHRKVLIYHRTSPATRALLVDELPEDQLAKCISYLNVSDEVTEADLGSIIFDQNLSRSTRTRPGMIRTIAKIVDGGVSDVIITCSNRISSDVFALFFGSVCKLMNTNIHCATNIGLEYNDMVVKDMQRGLANKSINQEYIQSRHDIVEEEMDRCHYENIQRIKSRLLGRFKKRYTQCHVPGPDYEAEEVDEGLNDDDDSSDD